MPSERKSKEDTWTPSELKKAMGKDAIRKEREERKKERLREEQNGEEKHRRRRDEDDTREKRRHREDDDRKPKEKDRHRNDDEDRRRRKDRGSPDRNEMTEEERERQRRERREKREGKSKDDGERRRRHDDDDDSKRRKHRDDDEDRDKERRRRDEERDRERRHKDKERDRDRRNKDDEKDKERRHKDEDRDRERRHKDEKRRHRNEDDDDDRRRHRGDDDERRRHRDDDDREKRRHHRDEDERDRRKEKKDRDRNKENEEGNRKHRRHKEEDEDMHIDIDEDERERQRRERREKREGKDRDRDREKDRERDKRKSEERGKSAKTRDVRVSSSINGRSKKVVEEEPENDEYGYEDDFEDYEEDFEDEEDDVPHGKTTVTSAPKKQYQDYSKELASITPRAPKHGLEYSDDEMNQVLRALDEENDRLYNDSKRNDKYDRSDSPEDRGRGYRDDSPDERVTQSRPKSSAINFLSAKRQVMTQQAYGKTSKRARDLLEMIELDTVSFDLMDLPPVKEYELYIRSYGRSDTRQAYVQTNDDAIERDIQTDEIDTRSKWTQHPAEDFTGSGRGDGEKDFQEEEKSQMNKQQDLGRLSKFIKQAGQVVSILLDEERSQERTELSANKSNISMSEGYTELSMLSILQGRHVESAYFAPTQPNMLLTVYSKPKESDAANPTAGKGIICVWNTNEPSYPQRILACESQPQCCCFSPYKTSLAFAGMVDGSICAWDLREPPSLHKPVEYDNTEHFLRFPTYNTAGILESDNHISPVTTINPVVTYVDENSQEESNTSEESGSSMSFQLVSSEDQGTINFWVVAEISNPDLAGSEIDLGLSPGGKIKVVISSSIKLENLIRETRTLGPVRSFDMQISPTDPNHFYIGTDGGYVLHGLRFGNRTFPRTFTTLSDTPVDVNCIDFSPFGHPCFLVSTTEGTVHLFGTKTEKPLLSWPSKIWGTRNIKCVRWSRSRPCVFYVLDDRSQLYTFDILEMDAMPVKMETLSKESVACIAFTSHSKITGRHPQMLVCQVDGSVQIHTISKDYREQQTLENDFLPSYLEKF